MKRDIWDYLKLAMPFVWIATVLFLLLVFAYYAGHTRGYMQGLDAGIAISNGVTQ
ncbi:MAG: hypothetical protein JW704_01295 [Anaerolineaceae bacterium]|nr:hypothetical protein [Anaerolineaceae bacterium]